MATITVGEINDKQIWESFLMSHPEANFLQSWYWGEFHKAIGHQMYRSGFYQEGKLIGVMLSIVEAAKRGTYLIVPAGPIIDWGNEALVTVAIDEMKRIAKQNNCAYVRVRPQLESNDFSKALFKKYQFIDAPTHLHAELTSQLDITKSEEELLAQMRKGTRYEVKKAQSTGIKITTTTDPEAIKEFYDLQLITAKRQKFVPFSYKFLYEQFKIFASEDKALLYNSYFEDTLLAQAFIIFYGQEAAYHYGASTPEGRNYPGAYLIQWEAIKEAKKRGIKNYNLWGVSPVDQKDHRFYGISIFKRGFGGTDFEYLHARDLVINRPKYALNFAIEFLRKKLRHV